MTFAAVMVWCLLKALGALIILNMALDLFDLASWIFGRMS